MMQLFRDLPSGLEDLSSAKIDALRSVDLRLYFGNHGLVDTVGEQGVGETRVTDADYAGMEPLIDSLDAQRGDVFAFEAYGHDRAWNLEKYLDAYTDWHMRGSPYLTKEDYTALRLPVDKTEVLTEADTARVLQAVEKLRSHWLINPIDYVSVRAGLKGVTCRYADASRQEENAWWQALEQKVEAYPMLKRRYIGQCLGLYVARAATEAEMKFRDGRTLSRLGTIALSMPTSNEEAPVLNYAGGAAHRKHIEQLLDAREIPYESFAFSPSIWLRCKVDMFRDVASLCAPWLDSAQDRYRKLWLANADQQQIAG